MASPSKCPPLIKTFFAPNFLRSQAAFFISSIVSISLPNNSSASGKFGVIKVDIGINFSIKVFFASSDKSLNPLFEIITGSNTIWGNFSTLPKALLMASIDSILDTMPIFMAPTSISLKITSICFSIISGVTSIIPKTPWVFWAVMAVIILIP